MLQLRAKEVLTTDPYVVLDSALKPLEEVLRCSDILVLCVPHSQYKHLDVQGKPLVDIWAQAGNGTLI